MTELLKSGLLCKGIFNPITRGRGLKYFFLQKYRIDLKIFDFLIKVKNLDYSSVDNHLKFAKMAEKMFFGLYIYRL